MRMLAPIEGKYFELLEQATTGLIIEVGEYPFSEWGCDEIGLVIKRDTEFFLVQEDGKEKSLGAHTHDRWAPPRFGLILSKNFKFTLIRTSGEIIQLGDHICSEWTNHADGIMIRRGNKFSVLVIQKD